MSSLTQEIIQRFLPKLKLRAFHDQRSHYMWPIPSSSELTSFKEEKKTVSGYRECINLLQVPQIWFRVKCKPMA